MPFFFFPPLKTAQSFYQDAIYQQRYQPLAVGILPIILWKSGRTLMFGCPSESTLVHVSRSDVKAKVPLCSLVTIKPVSVSILKARNTMLMVGNVTGLTYFKDISSCSLFLLLVSQGLVMPEVHLLSSSLQITIEIPAHPCLLPLTSSSQLVSCKHSQRLS